MLPSKLYTESGTISYFIKDNKATIIEYSGKDLIVDIPEKIEDANVVCIKKKAFLSQKFVKEIHIPDSIEIIEDYAFARCRKLETIYIPYKKIVTGQDILMDCDRLSYIYDSCSHNDKEDVAFLLAKTLNGLNAAFLFDLEKAGSDEWLSHLDATIDMRMKKDDMEDFSKLLLCGEEEVVCAEDGTIEDSDPMHYKSNRIKEKVRLAFMRLLHDYKLSDELRQMLEEYLLKYVKGCKSEETWLVVLNEHGDEQEYYDYLISIDGINKSILPAVLLDMRNRHTEMKSYLISFFDENRKEEDAFSEFEL